jgi:hypothetical protein
VNEVALRIRRMLHGRLPSDGRSHDQNCGLSSDRNLLHEPMVCAGTVRDPVALGYDLRVIYAALIDAMVIGYFRHRGVLVAFVGAIGNPPIALPISDTFLASDIDAKVLRSITSSSAVISGRITSSNKPLS